MAHVNRRIGKSSETANPSSADGHWWWCIRRILHDYFNREGKSLIISPLLQIHKD